jgi:hypothetical protein
MRPPKTTDSERIADVIAIIGPDKARVTEIEQAVRELAATKRNLKLLGPPMGLYRPLNKADKTMAKSIGLAIKRLEQTLDGANVGQLIDRATYTASGDFYEWKAQLKYWRECFEVFGGVAQAEPEGLFESPKRPWPLAKGPKAKTTEKYASRHRAVEAAARLLASHGLPLTASRETDTRPASVFCRVAAALTDNKGANLEHECRAFIRKTRNKVRG